MVQSPKLRTVIPEDAPEIYHLIGAMHSLAQYPIGPQWTLAQVEEECRAGGWVLLGERSTRIEAFLLYRDSGVAWEIEFLGTAPAARGQGLMTTLLGHMIKCRPVDREIWLEVHEANEPARRLYERSGFRMVGQRPRYYSDGGSACLYNYG